MTITTRGRYALRVMLDLAENGGGRDFSASENAAATDGVENGIKSAAASSENNAPKRYLSLTEVAARQQISFKYLESIIASLHRAGYLESRRGKTGGYRLAKSAAEYSVGGILKAAEGTLAPVSCLDGVPCDKAGRCLTLPVWKELDRRMDEYLESVTLEDVLCGNVGESAPPVR